MKTWKIKCFVGTDMPSHIIDMDGNHLINVVRVRPDDVLLMVCAPELLEMVKNLSGLAKVRGNLGDYKSLLEDAADLIKKAGGE